MIYDGHLKFKILLLIYIISIKVFIMNNLTKEDEEFLDAISELSEEKKNIIIAYIKNRCK